MWRKAAVQFILGGILAAIMMSAAPGTAQPVSDATVSFNDSTISASADGELTKTVIMPRSRMTAEEAIQVLAENIGLNIAYGDHILSPSRPVQFSQRRQTGREFLNEIVAGTNVDWTQVSRSHIVLVRRRPPVTPPPPQEGAIQGTVTDGETGEPLPGVNVVIPSLTIGAATNLDGEYEITRVPEGEHTVRAGFVGYQTHRKTVTVSAGETVTLDFVLRPSQMEMDELVVTGTGGNARRREIGNSISQINESSIDEAVPTFGDVLQGQAAGVSVLSNSGQVGAGRTIRLRGNSSVTQGNSPIIYIDGIRVQNQTVGNDIEVNQTANVLDDINPADIERVEIIKGPAATTLYGSEASNGVIQIFTKQGVEGDAEIRFSTEQGVNYLGQVGTQDIHSELSINNCSGEPGCPSDGDWLSPGHKQNYNLSVRGGTGTFNYYVSGEWGDTNGAFDAPQSTGKYSVRGNFGFNPLESVNVRFSTFYSRRDITWIPDGNNADGLLLNSLRVEQAPVPDESEILDLGLTTNTDHFTSGVTLNWSPRANLNQSLKMGLDYVLSEYIEERPFGYVREPDGNRENQTEMNIQASLDYSGSLELQLAESVSSNTSWGGQLYRDVFNSLEVLGEGFSGIGDKVVTSGARTEVRDEDRITTYTGGVFMQERVGWRDRMFVTLGVRVDGSSTFGDDFGLAPYPKASVSYLISEHTFWPAWWDDLKLRAAYGESGRLPGPFDAVRTFDSVPGDNGQPGLSPGNPGNADLGPERSREVELGFEGSALDDRISGSFTWYRQRTNDAIVNVQPAPSQGFPESAPQNVGTLGASGVELDLNVTVLDMENFAWDVGGNFSTSHTEAIDLGGREIEFAWDQGVREGSSVPSFFGNVLENPNQIPEDPSNIQYKPELQNLGPTFPPRELAIRTSVTLWDDLTVEVLGQGQYGHVLSAGTARENAERGIWPGCDAIVAQINEGDRSGLTARQLGRCDPQQIRDGQWVFPADFFRLRSASVQYRVPQRVLPKRMQNLVLNVQGRNLLTFTDYPGLDPEAYEDGSNDAPYRQEYYNLPPTKSITVSLSTSF